MPGEGAGVRPAAAPAPDGAPRREHLADLGLLGLVIFAWSTSWIALKLQTGVIAAEVSVFWRFLFATPLMMLFARMTGARLRFSLRLHLAFLLLGILMFSSNFILAYHGALHLASGLLSVVFSLASVINLGLAFALFGDRPGPRVLVGGLLGFLGVALMFEPEIARGVAGPQAMTGLAFCVAATFSFCLGNMLSSRLQRRGVPVIGATAWGIFYGALWSGVLSVARGETFAVEWTLPYLGGMAWLVLISTMLAFIAYLTLLGRVGPARAGYATVFFPVVALLISAFAEGYHLAPIAGLGLVLVALGNFLVMRR